MKSSRNFWSVTSVCDAVTRNSLIKLHQFFSKIFIGNGTWSNVEWLIIHSFPNCLPTSISCCIFHDNKIISKKNTLISYSIACRFRFKLILDTFCIFNYFWAVFNVSIMLYCLRTISLHRPVNARVERADMTREGFQFR